MNLTQEQLDALRRFADAHGRNWKQALRDAWMNASEPGTLQQLRNASNFGPAGLNAFSFKTAAKS